MSLPVADNASASVFAGFSENALEVLRSRYLRKESGKITENPVQMFRRVAKAVASCEARWCDEQKSHEYEQRFLDMMLRRQFMPNSPTLMNAGLPLGSLSACYVLEIPDSLGCYDGAGRLSPSIMKAAVDTAMIQRSGGGTGFTLDNLRESGSYIASSGGVTSGPISFWRMLSEVTHAIQQGALRRGANMMMMSIDHPDILKFICAKEDRSQFENYNISVKITDEWMQVLRTSPSTPHVVTSRKTGLSYRIPKRLLRVVREALQRGLDDRKRLRMIDNCYTVQDLAQETADMAADQDWVTHGDVWNLIVGNAHRTGEPGVMYIDRVRETESLPHVGRIEATNPCVTGDTLILTAGGPRTFSELHAAGQDVLVHCWDPQSKLPAIRMMRDIRITERQAQLLEVEFNSGLLVRCTTDHHFYTMSGEKIAARDLEIGHSVQAFAVSRDAVVCVCGSRVVVGVRTCEPADVYNGTVDECHTYIILEPEPCGVFSGVVSANCGEQPLLPNEACNLGSINVSCLLPDSPKLEHTFYTWDDVDQALLRDIVDHAVRFLDDVIEVNHYPTAEIEEMCRRNRKIGLGIMGLADLLFKLGLAYDSPEARRVVGTLMNRVNQFALEASVQLAKERGNFPTFDGSRWQTERGYTQLRNGEVTTIAPSGTISIIAGCSCGIEPLFALCFERRVLEGKLLMQTHPFFEQVARERGFWSDDLPSRILIAGSIRHLPDIPGDIKKIFVCAHDVAPHDHIQMQAICQKHVGASISKTINLAAEASVGDVEKAFHLAYDTGCKSVTVYRDRCRDEQPMSTRKADTQPVSAIAASASPGGIEAVPDVCPSVRLRGATVMGNLHVHVSVDPETNRELEIFAQLGHAGSLEMADTEAICRLASRLLRKGDSVLDLISQLGPIRAGMPTTGKSASNIPQGLARVLTSYLNLKMKYGDGLLKHFSSSSRPALTHVTGGNGNGNGSETVEKAATERQGEIISRDKNRLETISCLCSNDQTGYKIKCPLGMTDCAGFQVREGTCTTCLRCGASSCA